MLLFALEITSYRLKKPKIQTLKKYNGKMSQTKPHYFASYSDIGSTNESLVISSTQSLTDMTESEQGLTNKIASDSPTR